MADTVVNTEALSKYFMGADLQEILRVSLKREPTKMDFKVASKAASLFLTLPSSHGMTSVIKTLLGKAKQTKKQDGYGIVAGMKEYGMTRVKSLCETLDQFLRQTGVLHEEDIKYNPKNPDDYCPEWIRKRVVCDLEVLVLAGYMEMLGEQYGTDTPVPVKQAECQLKPKDVLHGFVKTNWPELLDGLVVFLKTECVKPAIEKHSSYGRHDTKSKLKDGSSVFSFSLPFVDVGEYTDTCPAGWKGYDCKYIRLIVNVDVDGKTTGWKFVFKDPTKIDPRYSWTKHPDAIYDTYLTMLTPARIENVKSTYLGYFRNA